MKNGKPKIGSPKKPSLSMNCLLCMRFRVCRDPAKKAAYACSRFKETDELTKEDLEALLDTSKESDIDRQIASANDEETLSDLIENVLNSGVPVPPDLRLNDRHLPRPKNFYDWTTNPAFIGASQKPFPRQVQVGLTYMAEFCPHCTDMEFFETLEVDTPLQEIESNVVMLEHGKCPRCKATKAELVESGDLNDYLTLACCAGQRSGKSSLTALIESYAIARWLLTPNISETYNILQTTPLQFSYTAITFKQAKSNLWDPIASIISTSKWFTEYHHFLSSEGRKYGEELYTYTETILRYKHKNLIAMPVSPSKRTLRGFTRAGAACFVGDTLVSTNEGLIPIKDITKNPENSLYSRVGHTEVPIIRAWKVGKKNTLRVVLKNGQSINVSDDQKILTHTNNKFNLKEAREITTSDRVVISVGSLERKPLKFNYEPCCTDTVRENRLREILRHKTFTLEKVCKNLGETNRNPITALTSRLKKLGIISAKRVPTATGYINKYRVLTNKSFKELRKELWVSSTIKKRREDTIYPTKTSFAFGWVIAALISDGSYQSDVEFSYNTSNIKKRNLFLKYMKKLFGVTLSYSTYRLYSRHSSMYKVHIGVRGIKEFLRFAGLSPATSYTKTVPWSILQSDSETQRGFLQSYILHDGSQSDGCLAYWSKSKKVLEAIQLLLLENGFYSAKRRESLKIRHPYAHDLFDWLDLSNTPGKYSFAFTFSRGSLNTTGRSQVAYDLGNGLLAVDVQAILNTGRKTVYDLSVDTKNHLFTGNGITVKNCDEIGWYPIGKTKGGEDYERLDGKEVYKALENSLTTLRGAYKTRLRQGYSNLPKPLFTNISSPSAKNDMIMTLYRQSNGSREIYGIKAPTWEMNPLLPKETFSEQYRITPVEAERDFGCEPPLGMNAWLSNLHDINGCFTKRKNGIETKSVRSRTKNNKLVMSSRMKTLIKPKNEYGGVLTLDAGYTNNSFAFAICYPLNVPDRESLSDEDSGETDFSVKVRVYAVGEVIPKSTVPVSFTKLYKNVLLPICEQFDIGYVISDRWQNIKLLQDLEEATGVEYLEHRLSYGDFSAFREAMYESMVELPDVELPTDDILNMSTDDYPHCFYMKPVSHLYLQLGTVQDTGSAVVKGPDATDDIFRCIALGYTVLQMPDILEGISQIQEVNEPAPAMGVALTSMNRGSGSGTKACELGVVLSRTGVGGGGGRSTGGASGSVGVSRISKR